MTLHSPRTAFWLLMLVNLIWGAGFVVIDDAIKVMPVFTFNAFRFTVATVALLPLWLLVKTQTGAAQNPYTARQLFKTGSALGLLLFLGFSLQAQGLLYTSVSNTGFITGLCVPLVPIIGFVAFKTGSVARFGSVCSPQPSGYIF